MLEDQKTLGDSHLGHVEEKLSQNISAAVKARRNWGKKQFESFYEVNTDSYVNSLVLEQEQQQQIDGWKD